jgi:hypothetical protein
MKQKKHLQTNFLRFLLERNNLTEIIPENQELPEEETNLSNKKLSDDFDKIINGDEDEIDNDEENIDDLIKEYRLLEKIYKSKTYGNIYNTKSKRK